MLGASNSIIVRLKYDNVQGILSKIMAVIADNGGNIGAIDIVRSEAGEIVRDLTIYLLSTEHKQLIKALNDLPGVEVQHISDRTFLIHLGGKIEIKNRIGLKNRDDLSMAYTPGVARVCMAIHERPEDAFNLTIKGNMVAVVTDGTAVLGLGDIGPKAALPVMEGKAMLFKKFAEVNAFPICLDTKETDEIVKQVIALSPGFGGINLEDISAPRCFEIEKRLKEKLDIPVFHDDQHGTAIVVTAAFINALKVTKKNIADLKIVFSGVGAAGMACTKMLLNLGAKNIIGCDRDGVVHLGRDDLDEAKKEYASITNSQGVKGTLKDVIKGADVFIGLSAPKVLDVDDIKAMNKDAIVFAMANPTPEIMPEEADPYVAIMATGRSDYPNQINNVLAFPGVFRGALNCRATIINEEMKLAAAQAIANAIPEDVLCADHIIPTVFDTGVVKLVAQAVEQAAMETNVARKKTQSENDFDDHFEV